MPAEARVVELTSMAVTEPRQGQGIGRRKLYPESDSGPGPALALYESAGFRHETRPEASDYARADVYMVFRGDVPE